MRLKALLVALLVVSFNAGAFAGADPGLPGKNDTPDKPTTVQANAPADTGTTSTDGEKPHKKHHRKNKHQKKHGKHHGKKNADTTTNTPSNETH